MLDKQQQKRAHLHIMGNAPSQPQPGAQIQVIGAGLSRTATCSFAQACSILLNGPSYHGGTQLTVRSTQPGRNSEDRPRAWHRILNLTPIKSDSDRLEIIRLIKQELDGYVACCDWPCAQLTDVLLDAYPDALVICTTRDFESWTRSARILTELAQNKTFYKYCFALLPHLRYTHQVLNDIQTTRWAELYWRPGQRPDLRATWERHHAWLESTVPPDRLFYFDVREGWGPLCKALGKEVPRDAGGVELPFPRVNEGAATREYMAACVRRGLVVWAIVLGFGVVVVAVLVSVLSSIMK